MLPSYKTSEYNWFSDVFWCYKNATLRSNKLKKAILKMTEKYVTKIFIQPLFFSLMIFFKLFFYFSSLDLITKVYSWQEKNRCNTEAEGQKTVNWHKNEGFPVVSKGKGWNYCTSNLEHTLLTFLLLTVYHLFIWHKIFKDLIDRNISNLG